MVKTKNQKVSLRERIAETFAWIWNMIPSIIVYGALILIFIKWVYPSWDWGNGNWAVQLGELALLIIAGAAYHVVHLEHRM